MANALQYGGVGKWYYPAECLPEDGENVVLRVGANFYVADFSRTKRAFVLKNGAEIPYGTPKLQWMRLTGAEYRC
jgi:hypothetical protein